MREKIKQFFCQHEFKLKDLKTTGIPEPTKPSASCLDYKTLNDFFERWQRYWDTYYHGEWVNKRVSWTCHKCKKEFFAHCGLDISPKFGRIIPS